MDVAEFKKDDVKTGADVPLIPAHSDIPSDTIMNQDGNENAVKPSTCIVVLSSPLPIKNPTASVSTTSVSVQMDTVVDETSTPITNKSTAKILEHSDLPSLTASNLITTESKSDLNDVLRDQSETVMLSTGMEIATELRKLLFDSPSPLDKRNRQLVQSQLEFFKLTIHSRFTSYLINEHNSSGGFGQPSKPSTEKVVKTGKPLKPLKNLETDSSSAVNKNNVVKKMSGTLKPALPFPDHIISRLNSDPVMKVVIDLNKFIPLITELNKWKGRYEKLSCAYHSLVLFLMSSKVFVKYLFNVKDVESKPLHFVICWIMRKIVFSAEDFTITDSGMKNALDSQVHSHTYFSKEVEFDPAKPLKTGQVDADEILLHIFKVLTIECGLDAIVSLPNASFSCPDSIEGLQKKINEKLSEIPQLDEVGKIFTYLTSNSKKCNKCNVSSIFLSPEMKKELVCVLPEVPVSILQLVAMDALPRQATELCIDCRTLYPSSETTLIDHIVSFPPLLVLKLNRSDPGPKNDDGITGDEDTQTRNKKKVLPDLTLELEDVAGKKVIYDLLSVILHEEGKGTLSGHFVAIVKFTDNQFRKYDDIGSKCPPYNMSDYVKQSGKDDSQDGYLFLYERRIDAESSDSASTMVIDTNERSGVQPISSFNVNPVETQTQQGQGQPQQQGQPQEQGQLQQQGPIAQGPLLSSSFIFGNSSLPILPSIKANLPQSFPMSAHLPVSMSAQTNSASSTIALPTVPSSAVLATKGKAKTTQVAESRPRRGTKGEFVGESSLVIDTSLIQSSSGNKRSAETSVGSLSTKNANDGKEEHLVKKAILNDCNEDEVMMRGKEKEEGEVLTSTRQTDDETKT